MISVVIPLYNKEKEIKKTLKTVLKQSFQDFEIVIVNDGSTDNSVIEAKKIEDPRIRLIYQPNAGVSAARNKGINEAQYELIAFLDADDEWKPEYLKTQYDLYQKYPQCSVFVCNYEFRDDNGNTSNTIIRRLPFNGTDGILSNYFEVASYSHPPISSISIMVKKQAIQAVGGFPIGIKSGEDLLTWAKLAACYQIAYNNISCAIFQRLAGNAIELASKIRLPEEPDIVGMELKKLALKGNDKYRYHYLANWNKMRSNLYFRGGKRNKSIKYALKAIYYNPAAYKNWGYLFFNFLPKKIVALMMGRL